MAADESHDDRTQSFVALTSGTTVSHNEIIEKISSTGVGLKMTFLIRKNANKTCFRIRRIRWMFF